MGGFFLLGDSLTPALDGLNTDEALDHAEQVAQEVQDSAQQNAPWADRTGEARMGLQAEATREGDEIVVTLAHTVEYGIWLELIQSGRFAIIMPTLEQYAAEIHQAVAEGTFSEG